MATVQLTDQEHSHASGLVERLSFDEREVVGLAVDGHKNSTMARKLGVAVRTIEQRRSRAMHKLKVRSVPDLVKIWLAYTGQFSINGIVSAELNQKSEQLV